MTTRGIPAGGTHACDAGGTPAIPVPIDLSAYSGITRIEIVDVHEGESLGFSVDDFSFTIFL